MNLTLHEYTRNFIAERLATLSAPCVASSFGKDSMVMLYFIREQRPDIPVLYFRHFEQAGKHAFADQIAREWGLNISYPNVRYRDFYGHSHHVEILNIYEISPERFIITPIEPQPELVVDDSLLCGADLLQQGSSREQLNFDGVFVGQRFDDHDVIMGDEIISAEISQIGDFQYIFPLAKWTNRDIWDAVRRYEIPVNSARYGARDINANNDLWNLCTRCFASDEPVTCPKIGLEVAGMADLLDLRTRTRQTFDATLNLKGKKHEETSSGNCSDDVRVGPCGGDRRHFIGDDDSKL